MVPYALQHAGTVVDTLDLPPESREQLLQDNRASGMVAEGVHDADPNDALQDIPAAAPEGEGDDPEAYRRAFKETKRKTAEFVHLDHVYDQLFIMMQSLSPSRRLMAVMIKENHWTWHAKQQASLLREGKRDWNITKLCRGCHLNTMLQQCGDLLVQPEQWQALQAHTHCHSSMLVRFTAKAAALIYQNCLVATRLWPWPLFKLLDDRSSAPALREQAASTPCILDTFGKDFLLKHPGLDTESCFQTLAALAEVLDCTTYSTETLHARNLRVAKRRVQTHAAEMSWIAMPHQIWSGPAWQKHILQRAVSLHKGRAHFH